MTKRFCIALDAGHGLYTPGKQTPNGVKEWTLNDKVRDKVAAILRGYEVEVIHTDNNEGATDESLSYRVNKYLKAKVNAFVSIHHNAFKTVWNDVTGVEVYVDYNCTANDLKLATLIYNKLVKYTGLTGRGIKRMNFAVINQNSIPAVLIEGGFMDGKHDYNIINSEAGQNAYAKAVAEGLIEFLNLKKKTTTKTGLFQIKVANVTKGDTLNIREKPDPSSKITGKLEYNDPKTYTIIETKKVCTETWGHLKSKIVWINLRYTKRV